MQVLISSLLAIALGTPAAFGQVTSGDGAWIARALNDGHVLAIEDRATGAVAHTRSLVSRTGGETRVAALIAVPARRSFLVVLEGVPELWEIALFAEAGPFHDGFVHSWEAGMEEGLAAERGLFARQRIMLEAPVVALAPRPGKRYSVIGTRADGTRVEINLAVRREVAVLPPE